MGEAYGRLMRFDARWKPLVRMALGAIWTATSIFLIVVAVNVWSLEKSRDDGRRKEAATVRVACERSQVLGVPLIEHIERVEARLHTGALEHADGSPITVEYPKGSRRHVAVLPFFRSTIPASCAK